MRVAFRHCRHEQVAVEKQIAHLAARFGDKKTAVAGSAVGGAVAAAVIRLVVRADRIVGAYRGAIKRTPQNVRETRHRSHEPTQRALGAGGRRVNENA
jgi:hypothetical protein